VDEGLIVLADVEVVKYTHRPERPAGVKESSS
jgi:hypothetical protein